MAVAPWALAAAPLLLAPLGAAALITPFGGGGGAAAAARAGSPALQLVTLGGGESGQSDAASDVPVAIDVTGINSRGISASIVVDASPAQVWSILTGAHAAAL